MTEQDRDRGNNADVSTPPSGDAVTETVEETPSANVRDVIGRRGYDEGEDETANEDEEH